MVQTNNFIVLILFLSFITIGFSQNNPGKSYGLFGKKYSVSGTLQIQNIAVWTTSDNLIYKEKNNNIEQKTRNKRGSFSVQISRHFKNTSIGLELSTYRSFMTRGVSLGGEINSISYHAIESLFFRTFALSPSIQFSTKNGNAPLGLRHEFGATYGHTFVANSPKGEDKQGNIVEVSLYNPIFKNVKSVSIYYAIQYSVMITPRLVCSMRFKWNLPLFFNSSSLFNYPYPDFAYGGFAPYFPNTNYAYEKEEIDYKLFRQEIRSPFRLGVGINYFF